MKHVITTTSYCREGFTVHFNEFAIVNDKGNVLDWLKDEHEARNAAQSVVEEQGGQVRVLKVIAQYRAVAEEKGVPT